MDYENMTAEERGIAQAEARFGYYREKTTEELQKELENLDIDLDDWEKVLSNATITEEANDARREIRYVEEKIRFVEKVLSERGAIRK